MRSSEPSSPAGPSSQVCDIRPYRWKLLCREATSLAAATAASPAATATAAPTAARPTAAATTAFAAAATTAFTATTTKTSAPFAGGADSA